MMTVIDPAGTPNVVFNRDGTAIATLTSIGQTQADAAPIVRYSGWTVVMVTTSNADGPGQTNRNSSIVLPADAETGDLVELHIAAVGADAQQSIFVYPESGAEINLAGTDQSVFVTNSALFRKVGSGHWYSISVQ